MDHLLIAVGIVLAGGVLPLLLISRFALCKALGVAGISAGCLLGLFSAGAQLFAQAPRQLSVSYQHIFMLAFSMDGLSAFFLIAIFVVSLIAAIYSFHYLDKPERAGRTAAHYLFFSLLQDVAIPKRDDQAPGALPRPAPDQQGCRRGDDSRLRRAVPAARHRPRGAQARHGVLHLLRQLRARR